MARSARRDKMFPFDRAPRTAGRSDTPMNATTRPSAAPVSYEQAVGELERLVQQLESGQMSLDDTLHAYARGAELLRHCRERLQAVEQQVQVLDGTELKTYADADGERDGDA